MDPVVPFPVTMEQVIVKPMMADREILKSLVDANGPVAE